MSVGPAFCTRGVPICSEILRIFAWSRKVPSIRSVSQGSSARVSSRICTQAGETHALDSLFIPRSYLAFIAESDSMKQNYTLTLPTTLQH